MQHVPAVLILAAGHPGGSWLDKFKSGWDSVPAAHGSTTGTLIGLLIVAAIVLAGGSALRRRLSS